MPQGRLAQVFGITIVAACIPIIGAQVATAPTRKAEVMARLAPTHERRQAHSADAHKTAKIPPAVIWLKSIQSGAVSGLEPGNFTLLQKNKMFTPHLLVVPVGSSVAFPNADPFFHNVFSLFDGRRFDLGLYEAGSTRSVVFSREGVSYIFCNIHSEMSAVVISLTTPLYAIADQEGVFHLKDVPDGEYELHVWIEGQRQSSLNLLEKRVQITGTAVDLGEIHSDHPDESQHLNKFGRPYEPDTNPIY
jgi:plastocyanin